MILRHSRASRPAPPSTGGSWAYCGREGLDLPVWRRALGPSWRQAELGPHIQAAARELRKPYVEWVDGLSRRFGKDPDWWATQTAERNPLADPFFLDVCLLAVFTERAKAGRLPDLVVCEDWGLLAALRGLPGARSEGFPASGLSRHRLGLLAKLLARSAGFLRGAVLASLRRPPRIPPESRPRVLVATFAHERLFGADGRFLDLYFGKLHGWLEAQGFEVWTLPTACDAPSFPRAAFVALRRSGGRFVLREDWLKAADHLAALRGAWTSLGMPSGTPPLAGMDVSALAAEQRWRQARSLESFEARLTRRLPARLAEGGLRPRIVLSWFENHKAEKCLALGLHSSSIGCRHLGFLCIPPNPNYLTAFPTPAEDAAGVLPDRLICCGRHPASLMRAFGSAVDTRLGAALRYDYLWSDAPSSADRAEPSALIPLPSRLSESAEVLRTVRELMSLETGVRRWWVKPHPDYTLEALRSFVGEKEWPPALELRAEGMRELLSRCAVLVSAASGTLVEAACAGVPVVILGRAADLDFNPLEWFPDFPGVCRDAADAAGRIRHALSMGPGERDRLRDAGRRLRSDCFEPVNETTLSPFFDREGPVHIKGGCAA